MKTKLNLWFLFLALMACAGCSNYVDDYVDEADDVLSRAVSSEYYINGADKIYTDTPETYMIKAKDGSLLPYSVATTWSYPSELQRLGSTNSTITFKQTTAVGTYTIKATFADGTLITKTITAVNTAKPSTPNTGETLNAEETAKLLYIMPIGISNYSNGPYSDIDQYRYANRNYFYVSSSYLYVKCTIENRGEHVISIDPSLLSVAYSDNRFPIESVTVTDAQSNILALPLNIEKGESVALFYYLKNSWNWYQQLSLDSVFSFNFFYSQYSVSSTGYGYRLTRTN